MTKGEQMSKKSSAGIVTINIAGKQPIRLGIPNVTTPVRRALEVLGTLFKAGNHYDVECDPSEPSLLKGIVQRLIKKHAARIFEQKHSDASKNLESKTA